jgi:signal transduction histidine kinase
LVGFQKGSSIFKPRARLLSLLGEQLITNEVIAVVELVKNAFDADATTVTLLLKNVSDVEEGEIIIEDNGTGMTLDTILNVWLEPGTEFRKTQREKGERSKIYKRPLLGEKGIGRFAAHRLGNVIVVITRTEGSESEINVEVNWRMFEQNKYLEEIPVYWWTSKPSVFIGKKYGTRIVIRDLKKLWTQDMVADLKEKLEALQAPLKEKYNFEIKLVAPEFPDIEERKEISLDEIIKTALYSFEGSIDEKGYLRAVYEFKHDTFPEETRKEKIEKDIRELKKFSLPEGGLRFPRCGPFNIRFYVWDLDPTDLKETVTRRRYDREIKPRTGVRIYRDGFRVWSYGELGNDWLNLDIRRVNNPTKCLSNNQILGIVNISGDSNSRLRDKTDREGIIDNEAFEDFKDLVLFAISEFEWERREDRDKISFLRERKKRIDRTTEAIDKLREKMKRGNDFATYKQEIVDVENAYFAEARDTIEPLIVSAGIGIAYQMPAHEITLSIKDLEKLIRSLGSDLERLGVGGQISETIPNMLKITDIIRDVADGALELTRRKGQIFPLRSTVDFAHYIKKPSLIKEKIEVKIVEKDKITIRGRKNLVMACILNLLDNSIYWLSNTQDKLIQIVIDHDTDSKPRIIVSDNGPGIRREDLPYLGEAYWTRKPDGTGLGLFISKRAMRANNGEVDFGFFGEEPDFLSGANVILRFSPEVEIKG